MVLNSHIDYGAPNFWDKMVARDYFPGRSGLYLPAISLDALRSLIESLWNRYRFIIRM